MQKQITIDDIEKKEFAISARGYNREEVDTFLDDICDEIERLLGENDRLQKEIDRLNTVRPDPAPAPAAPVRAAASSVSTSMVEEVLQTAVRLKEQVEQEARAKADTLMQEAQSKADAILGDAEEKANARLANLSDEHDRLARQVENLRKAGKEYCERLDALMKEQRKALEDASDLF